MRVIRSNAGARAGGASAALTRGRWRNGWILAAFLLACPSAGWGQSAILQPSGEINVPEGTPVRKLTITPAQAPSPALKYRLVPPLRDLRPGNAALFYQRAHSPESFGHLQRHHPEFNKLSEYLQLPLKEFPRTKVEALVRGSHMRDMDIGARKLHCDWDMLDRLREEGFAMVLPDVQAFRTYGNLLSVRTRVHLLDGEYGKAIHSLQTHVMLGRHVSDAPILINVLVGNAIMGMALKDVEEAGQLDGSPSLFWALVDLPRPVLHLERAMEGEQIMLDAIAPGIRAALDDPSRPVLTVEQIQASLRQLENFGLDIPSTKIGLAVMASRTYPQARNFLLERGFDEKRIEAMPVIQVALMYSVAEYDRLFDEFAKWGRQPYWKARASLRQTVAEMSKARRDQPNAFSLASLTLPAIDRVYESQARLGRLIGMLQIVEALRLHAGENEGALPAALDDIKNLPLPIDPMTGQSFHYELRDGKALLMGPPPPGVAASPTTSLLFEISVRKE